MIRRAPLALAVIVLAGCGSTSSALIAFTTTRDGNAEVYVMRADGTHVVDLTQNLAQDGEPSWSPDGKEIAFVSARDGLAQIFVMNANGSGVRRVTHDQWDDMAPVWSPDAAKLAFMCTSGSPHIVTEICAVDVDGSSERRLTKPSEHDNLYPHWSHDGKRILFTSMRKGTSVWEVAPGGGPEREFLAGDAEAVYSPDGTRIAFLEHDTYWTVVVENSDLRSGRTPTVGNGDADSPSWSPDGTRVAFSGGGAIYVDTVGKSTRRVTQEPGSSLSPVWSPDGNWIAFERLHGNSSEIGVVRADGTDERVLTSGAGKNGGPVWQP